MKHAPNCLEYICTCKRLVDSEPMSDFRLEYIRASVEAAEQGFEIRLSSGQIVEPMLLEPGVIAITKELLNEIERLRDE